MSNNTDINYSQCQSDLDKQGFSITKLTLPEELLTAVRACDYNTVDRILAELVTTGVIFKTMSQFCPVVMIEFIISLRESKNEWEEDGVWHDDGSRMLAFSMSLTLEKPRGGILEIRKKENSHLPTVKIPTPDYGEIIIFKTGVDGFEHKIT